MKSIVPSPSQANGSEQICSYCQSLAELIELVDMPYFDAEVFAKLQYRPDDEEPTTKPTTGTTGSTEPTEDIPDDDVPSGSTDDEDIDDPDVPKQELPETGMMQWPVPFMAMGGVVLFGMGYISEKKSKN